jgi:hypothetical protein
VQWQYANNIIGTDANPADPYLASGLANNGGPTQTIAAVQPPQGAKGAWQQGDPGLAASKDQRGFTRNTPVTIGAEDPGASPPS